MALTGRSGAPAPDAAVQAEPEPKQRVVLIALDGSARCPGVFRSGIEAARAMQARVILYRAILVPPEFPPAAATGHRDTLPAYLETQARGELGSLQASTPDVNCEVHVERAAQPWRGILEVAHTLDVDLIVLGSHGYDAVDRVLGTTAGTVANRAHRNVLIVHERSAR